MKIVTKSILLLGIMLTGCKPVPDNPDETKIDIKDSLMGTEQRGSQAIEAKLMGNTVYLVFNASLGQTEVSIYQEGGIFVLDTVYSIRRYTSLRVDMDNQPFGRYQLYLQNRQGSVSGSFTLDRMGY